MKWSWVRDNKEILLIISGFLVLRAFFLDSTLWWDSAVFTGMGKYICSLGSVGFWEAARPVILPLAIGAGWKVGIDPLIFGSILNIAASLGCIFFVYIIAKELTRKKVAIIFSLLFSLNLTFVFFSNIAMSDIPSAMLSLAATYLAVKKERFFLPGVLIGLALLTRFTHMVFIPVILLGILIRGKSLRNNILYFLGGVCVFVIPFLILSFFFYGNPVFAFSEGQKLISIVAMNYMDPTDSSFYIANLIATVPVLMILSLISFPRKSKNRWKYLVITLAVILPLIYHTFFVSYRNMRYALIFLPFLYLLGAFGFHELSKKRGDFTKYFLVALLITQIIISVAWLSYTYTTMYRSSSREVSDFENYLSNKKVVGELWSTTPAISARYDVKTSELIYYPVFDTAKADEVYRKLNSTDVQLIFINSCDIPCVGYGSSCEEKKVIMMNRISESFNEVFYRQNDGCDMRIFEWMD